jgi:hypothetical protein
MKDKLVYSLPPSSVYWRWPAAMWSILTDTRAIVPSTLRTYYEYYPDAEVYYEPQRHVYYWSEGGAWRSGAHVPQNFVLRSSVRVDLNSPEPYRHHDEVRAKYPRQRQEEEHERKRQDHDQH